MAAPVVLQYSRRSMQRLGFLKHLVARCNAQFTARLEVVGKDLVEAAQKRVAVQRTDYVSVYIRRRLQDGVYKELRERLDRIERNGEILATIEVEIQDAYLADPRLPSHTGKLVTKDWAEYPHLAVALGLVRKDSYALLVRGQAMLALCSPGELTAMRNGSLEHNPLMLTPGQRLFFLYALIDRDGDVLVRLLRDLLKVEGVFRDWEAGDRLPAIFRELERTYRNQATSAAERKLLQSLVTAADGIERKAGTSYASGKGAREERITPRLEPLVDVGLLTKPDPYTFSYTFDEQQEKFATRLTEAGSWKDFLDKEFFAAWAAAFIEGATHEENEAQVLEAIMTAWDRLKSPLGYAPIADSVLLGAIRHLVDNNRYFEVADGRGLLQRLQKQAPNWLRYSIDRQGNLRYLKFDGPQPAGLDL